MGIRGIMSMTGHDWILIATLLLLFTTFCGIVIWTVTRPKKVMDESARIPLDDHIPPNRPSNGDAKQ